MQSSAAIALAKHLAHTESQTRALIKISETLQAADIQSADLDDFLDEVESVLECEKSALEQGGMIAECLNRFRRRYGVRCREHDEHVAGET